MDTTESTAGDMTDTERMEHLLRVLHGVRAEIREQLQGHGAPAWRAWEHLDRELGVDAGPSLTPDPNRCEELEEGLKKAHGFLARLREPADGLRWPGRT